MQVFTSTNALVGSTATSGWFAPAAAGTYRWTALYNGDGNNNAVAGACQAPNESVAVAPFAGPPPTRTITGDFAGPVTVNSGDSVVITNARVVGPLTVNAGGGLTVVNSQISRGITATAPGFLSICGSQLTGVSPAPALAVASAAVPALIGDPANGCAGNRFAGDVITTNAAAVVGANVVSKNLTVNGNGPGNTVVKANTIMGAMACTGNNPAPANAGPANTAASKSGQCTTL
jgi:hypothetical protein